MSLQFKTEEEAASDLYSRLSGHFEIFPEVTVQHATFPNLKIRPDFVVIPKDEKFCDLALAFEVKSMKDADPPVMAQAFKQATDYVLSRIVKDERRADGLNAHVGKPIVACFIYPAPEWGPGDVSHLTDSFERENQKSDNLMHTGMMHLARYFGVGRGTLFENRRQETELGLYFGPNDVWKSSKGFSNNARNLLVGKRQFGSTRKNIADLLGI